MLLRKGGFGGTGNYGLGETWLLRDGLDLICRKFRRVEQGGMGIVIIGT